MDLDTVTVDGRKMKRGAAKGQVLAIFTSGGDAPGGWVGGWVGGWEGGWVGGWVGG